MPPKHGPPDDSPEDYDRRSPKRTRLSNEEVEAAADAILSILLPAPFNNTSAAGTSTPSSSSPPQGSTPPRHYRQRIEIPRHLDLRAEDKDHILERFPVHLLQKHGYLSHLPAPHPQPSPAFAGPTNPGPTWDPTPSRPIHPIFRRQNWLNTSDADWALLQPALHLATRILEEEALLHFWGAVIWGPHHHQAMSKSNVRLGLVSRRQRRLLRRENARLKSENHTDVGIVIAGFDAEALYDGRAMTGHWDNEDDGGARAYLHRVGILDEDIEGDDDGGEWARAEHVRLYGLKRTWKVLNKMQDFVTWTWKDSMGVFGSTHTADEPGLRGNNTCASNIQLNSGFIHALFAPDLSAFDPLAKNIGLSHTASLQRATFMLASTLAHEFTHALSYAVCTADWPHEEYFYRDGHATSGNEGVQRIAELGHAMESVLFGGRIEPNGFFGHGTPELDANTLMCQCPWGLNISRWPGAYRAPRVTHFGGGQVLDDYVEWYSDEEVDSKDANWDDGFREDESSATSSTRSSDNNAADYHGDIAMEEDDGSSNNLMPTLSSSSDHGTADEVAGPGANDKKNDGGDTDSDDPTFRTIYAELFNAREAGIDYHTDYLIHTHYIHQFFTEDFYERKAKAYGLKAYQPVRKAGVRRYVVPSHKARERSPRPQVEDFRE